MATDNNQNNNRIDILEAALQALAGAQRLYEETQRQQTAAIQRHDIEMEMLRAIQRDVAATQQDQAAAQQDQAASIQRHEDILQILAAIQQRQDAAIERHEATQSQLVNLVQTVTTMLHRVMDTQQEHSNDIRDLRENRDNSP